MSLLTFGMGSNLISFGMGGKIARRIKLFNPSVFLKIESHSVSMESSSFTVVASQASCIEVHEQ